MINPTTQLNSTSIYGRRCKTPQCPHLFSHYRVSSTTINLIPVLICTWPTFHLQRNTQEFLLIIKPDPLGSSRSVSLIVLPVTELVFTLLVSCFFFFFLLSCIAH